MALKGYFPNKINIPSENGRKNMGGTWDGMAHILYLLLHNISLLLYFSDALKFGFIKCQTSEFLS